MRNRLIGTVLAVLLLTASMCTGMVTEAAGFTDVSGLPCEEAVDFLAENGIVQGRSEGLFAPNEGLTRAEMVTIILRGFGSKEVEDIEKFRDVPPTHWAYMYVETAYKMGIINGMTETTFVPEGAVTYEQAVKMLVCAAGNESSAEKEGGWPDGYLKVAEEMGALTGMDGKKGEAITRGTMAQLVYNFLSMEEDEFGFMYNWDNGVIAEHYNWIREEKIRGAYIGPLDLIDPEYLMGRLNKLGINTFFINLLAAGYEYNTYKDAMALLDDTVKWLKNYDCHAFIKINYGDNGYCKNADYRAFHPGIYRTKYDKLVCPLDQDYWDKQLLERSLEIAKRPAIEGIILDFEMYYQEAPSGYQSNCMCDHCWSEYIKSKQLGANWEQIVATERIAFLEEKNASTDYDEWMYRQIVAKNATLVQKIYEVNPTMLIGYMPGFEFFRGVTEGLGTPERPVIILSEAEYWGSLASAPIKMKTINELGYHALYLPGLYPGKAALSPAELEKNIELVTTTTAGYWLYGTANCNQDEEYYNVIERANKLLAERVKTGELIPFPTYEVPTYVAEKIKGETPTEEEWANAALTDEFVYYKKPENKVLVSTHAKVLYSDTDIFVRIIANGDPSEITIEEKFERDTMVWDGANTEVFWRFDDRSDIMHVASSPAGTLWDSYTTGIGTQNSTVNFDTLESNTVVYGDRWETTYRIPGSMDGIRYIKTGDTLRMQISRYHVESGTVYGTEYIVWTPTHASFIGNSTIWGTLILD